MKSLKVSDSTHEKVKELASEKGCTISEVLAIILGRKVESTPIPPVESTGRKEGQERVSTGGIKVESTGESTGIGNGDTKKEQNSMSREEIEREAEKIVNEREGLETLKAIKAGVDNFCKLYPELCAKQEKTEKAIVAMTQRLKVGGTEHSTLQGLLACAAGDDKEGCFNGLVEAMPVALRVKLLKVFCQDGECQSSLGEEGLEGKVEEKRRGFLG